MRCSTWTVIHQPTARSFLRVVGGRVVGTRAARWPRPPAWDHDVLCSVDSVTMSFRNLPREHLAKVGVDLTFVLHDASCGPIYALIVVSADTGSRAIFVDPANIKSLEPQGTRSEWFQGAKVLMVDHLYPAIVLAAVQMARQLGLQVVSDIEMEMPQLAAIRAGIDHFICSAEFAVPYTGCHDPRTACEMLSRSAPHRAVVVTAGQEGCYWCTHDQSEVKHVPGHRIEPVDTTGCGDVFHGAHCHGLAVGWTIEHIIHFANAAAAVKATRTGGWAAVPTSEEVQQILERPAKPN